MKKAVLLMLVLTMIGICFMGIASAGPYDKYLTAAEVGKVSGLSGVKQVPRSIKMAANGDLNFAISDKQMVLMVQVLPKTSYPPFQKVYKNGKAVKGLGDQALQGTIFSGGQPTVTVFTKGSRCIALTTYTKGGDIKQIMLTGEQMIKLAKIIASRIK